MLANTRRNFDTFCKSKMKRLKVKMYQSKHYRLLVAIILLSIVLIGYMTVTNMDEFQGLITANSKCNAKLAPAKITHTNFGLSSFALEDNPVAYNRMVRDNNRTFIKRHRYPQSGCRDFAPDMVIHESGRLFTARELNASNYCEEKALIPRIIHQQWKSYDIPSASKQLVESIVSRHPQWEYWFWTNKDIDCYMKTRHPQLWPLFSSYASNIHRADVFRYVQMLDFGGFSIDLDVECYKPLDVWRYIAPSIMTHTTYENIFIQTYTQHANVYSGILASRPNHPFYKRALNAKTLKLYKETCQTKPLYCTGPLYQDNIYQEYIQENLGQIKFEDILVIHPR